VNPSAPSFQMGSMRGAGSTVEAGAGPVEVALAARFTGSSLMCTVRLGCFETRLLSGTLSPDVPRVVSGRSQELLLMVCNSKLAVPVSASILIIGIFGVSDVAFGAGNISVTPTVAMHFGDQETNTTSPPSHATVTNGGPDDLTVSLGLSGPDSSLFSVGPSSTCTALQTLAPFEFCTIGVSFTPDSAGAKAATLDIISDDLETPFIGVQLFGNGTPATVPVLGRGAGVLCGLALVVTAFLAVRRPSSAAARPGTSA
jgi:hypothetical protein